MSDTESHSSHTVLFERSALDAEAADDCAKTDVHVLTLQHGDYAQNVQASSASEAPLSLFLIFSQRI